jgi:hypothetical protein
MLSATVDKRRKTRAALPLARRSATLHCASLRPNSPTELAPGNHWAAKGLSPCGRSPTGPAARLAGCCGAAAPRSARGLSALRPGRRRRSPAAPAGRPCALRGPGAARVLVTTTRFCAGRLVFSSLCACCSADRCATGRQDQSTLSATLEPPENCLCTRAQSASALLACTR